MALGQFGVVILRFWWVLNTFFRAYFNWPKIDKKSQKWTCHYKSIPKPKKISISALAAGIFFGPVVRAALLAQTLT